MTSCSPYGNEVKTEGGRAPMETLGGKAQRSGGRSVDFAVPGGDDLAAGDAVVGTQAKPAREVTGGGETGAKLPGTAGG